MGINWNKLAVSYKSMVVSSVESEHFSLSQFRQKMFLEGKQPVREEC